MTKPHTTPDESPRLHAVPTAPVGEGGGQTKPVEPQELPRKTVCLFDRERHPPGTDVQINEADVRFALFYDGQLYTHVSTRAADDVWEYAPV